MDHVPSEAASDLPRALSAPARRALLAAGYTRLEQLTRVRATELGQLHGVGPRALVQLRRALHDQGWRFSDEQES